MYVSLVLGGKRLDFVHSIFGASVLGFYPPSLLKWQQKGISQ